MNHLFRHLFDRKISYRQAGLFLALILCLIPAKSLSAQEEAVPPPEGETAQGTDITAELKELLKQK